MYELVFNYSPTEQTLTLVSGSPVYKESYSAHTLQVNAELPKGNLMYVTFSRGGADIGNQLIMAKTVNKPIWTLKLPDAVLAVSGTVTIALAIKQPIIANGTTTYAVLTTGNATFEVNATTAVSPNAVIEQTNVDTLQAEIDTLAETIEEEQARVTQLIEDSKCTVDVGDTATGQPGTEASVVNSGTTQNAIFSFTIPSGEKGEQGHSASVEVGATTTGEEGTLAQVTNSGTELNAIFNFVVPRGNTGNGIQSIALTQTVGRANTYTVTYTDGETYSFIVYDGKSFYIAKTYSSVAAMNADFPNVPPVEGDFVLIASTVDDPDNAKMYVKGATTFVYVSDLSGAQGIQGVGVASVEKTATNALVDTYTITYTDGSTTTFTVTNGKGISAIAKSATVGLVDTYTVTYNDGTTTAFDVANGLGIVSFVKTGTEGLTDEYTITYSDGSTMMFEVENGRGVLTVAKTATVGAVDTYTITYNDGTTSAFQVQNGIDGTGSGNLSVDNATVNNTKKYIVAGANKTGTEVNATLTELVIDATPTNGSNNPISSCGVYDALADKEGTISVLPVEKGGTGNTSVDTTPNAGSTKMVTSGGVKAALDNKQAKNLTFSNTSIATIAWESDSTYTDYPLRATVALTGVTAAMIADVVYGLTDATGGNFAPVCETYAGGVYLYAKEAPEAAITIPTIIAWN